jgi:O-antigen ligase
MVLISVALSGSIATLPERRKELYAQLASENFYRWVMGKAYVSQKQGEQTLSCDMPGNSPVRRMLMVREALQVFSEHPLSGAGVGHFSSHSSCYDYKRVLGNPHNILLHLLAELGLIGLTLFAGTIALAALHLRRLIASKDEEAGRLAWLLLALGVYYFTSYQFLGGYLRALELYLVCGTSLALRSVLAPSSQRT